MFIYCYSYINLQIIVIIIIKVSLIYIKMQSNQNFNLSLCSPLLAIVCRLTKIAQKANFSPLSNKIGLMKYQVKLPTLKVYIGLFSRYDFVHHFNFVVCVVTNSTK